MGGGGAVVVVFTEGGGVMGWSSVSVSTSLQWVAYDMMGGVVVGGWVVRGGTARCAVRVRKGVLGATVVVVVVVVEVGGTPAVFGGPCCRGNGRGGTPAAAAAARSVCTNSCAACSAV